MLNSDVIQLVSLHVPGLRDDIHEVVVIIVVVVPLGIVLLMSCWPLLTVFVFIVLVSIAMPHSRRCSYLRIPRSIRYGCRAKWLRACRARMTGMPCSYATQSANLYTLQSYETLILTHPHLREGAAALTVRRIAAPPRLRLRKQSHQIRPKSISKNHASS